MRMSEFRKMSEKEREEAVSLLAKAAYGPPNGQLEEIQSRIREFEFRYEVPSERMVEELSKGERKETAEIASWLLLIKLRDNIGLPKPA